LNTQSGKVWVLSFALGIIAISQLTIPLLDAAAYVFAKILQRNFTAAIHSGSALLDVNSRVRFEDWFNQKAQSVRAFRKGPITVMNVVGTSLWDTCIEALPLRNENQVETLLLAEGKALSFLILNIAEPFDAHGM
jgi:hypothetical protein